MNDEKQPSQPQPLHISPPVWITLGLAVLVGLLHRWSETESVKSLAYLDGDRPVIVRSEQITHQFPLLGIKITPPQGWSYLSVADDALVTKAIFVNESRQAIVRVGGPWVAQWPDLLREKRRYGEATVEWIDLQQRVTVPVTASAMPMRHQWNQVDPRRVGRMIKGDGEVTLVVVADGEGSWDAVIDTFCPCIAFLDAVD